MIWLNFPEKKNVNQVHTEVRKQEVLLDDGFAKYNGWVYFVFLLSSEKDIAIPVAKLFAYLRKSKTWYHKGKKK